MWPEQSLSSVVRYIVDQGSVLIKTEPSVIIRITYLYNTMIAFKALGMSFSFVNLPPSLSEKGKSPYLPHQTYHTYDGKVAVMRYKRP